MPWSFISKVVGGEGFSSAAGKMYEPRTYRHTIRDAGLVSFSAVVHETDLYIRAVSDLSAEAIKAINECRRPLEQYIRLHPLFLHSLEPVEVGDGEVPIVRLMAEAARAAGVGPMAAVAGAVAQCVGNKLLTYSPEIIVENGGDIFLKSESERVIGIFAGKSTFTGKLALEVAADSGPLGICTSSGTVGPSLSLGITDATVVISPSAALADAAATAIGNLVKSAGDIQVALDCGKRIKGVKGVIIIVGDKLGAWGDVKLIEL